jgi:hypothetical protein
MGLEGGLKVESQTKSTMTEIMFLCYGYATHKIEKKKQAPA